MDTYWLCAYVRYRSDADAAAAVAAFTGDINAYDEEGFFKMFFGWLSSTVAL